MSPGTPSTITSGEESLIVQDCYLLNKSDRLDLEAMDFHQRVYDGNDS